MERFLERNCFQLTEQEFPNWKSQIVMSNSEKKGQRKMPFAFTEQGVAMLSAVLRTKTAIRVSLAIMDAFVQLRQIKSIFFIKNSYQLHINNIFDIMNSGVYIK
jgi:hypothetical protein